MNISALLTSAGINIGMCALLLCFYSILRKQPGLVNVYFGGRLLAQENIMLPDAFRFEMLLPSPSWILKAWKSTEDDILAAAGLDAVVFLRLLVFSIRIFSIAAVICMFLVLPLNYYGQEMVHRHIPSESLDVFTIGNVKEGSKWLWAHCLALYIITFSACILLYFFLQLPPTPGKGPPTGSSRLHSGRGLGPTEPYCQPTSPISKIHRSRKDNEYQKIAELRLAHFTGSPANPSHFTVLVRSIPRSTEESFSDAVKNFFMNYHASSYLAHQMIYRTGKVQRLMNNAEKIYKKIVYATPSCLYQECRPMRVRCGLCGGTSSSFNLYSNELQLAERHPGLDRLDSLKEKVVIFIAGNVLLLLFSSKPGMLLLLPHKFSSHQIPCYGSLTWLQNRMTFIGRISGSHMDNSGSVALQIFWLRLFSCFCFFFLSHLFKVSLS
ncbi:CSC1-like protein RXW8 isoform X2 [Magnolia sinica]|uniref:CSC1-like protein RXW8 isoform X2 n=1 Tax=Magnolia sinica TaxID=86752 RepID=UPI0026589F78|nr:CSC1-like protein RXW8 isoform X2 [Magnolia sinica]